MTMRHGLPRGQILLLVLTGMAALFSLLDTPFPRLAPMQNLPTLAVLAGIGASLRRWPMPTSAVSCVCLFLALHTIGGRYIYSYVPYEDWVRALGLPSPAALLGLERNSWDRLVHFAFGALGSSDLVLAGPVQGAVADFCGMYRGRLCARRKRAL